MDTFAFVIHPLDLKEDVARRYPLAKALPPKLLRALLRRWPPIRLSNVTGVRSETTGKKIKGQLLACPLSAQQILHLPLQVVYGKIVQTVKLAERAGAHIVGLGAYTSVIGDGGVTIAQRVHVPVTTGNSLTVALAIEALTKAAAERRVRPEEATAAVVGATGSIGGACAAMLAPTAKTLILIGKHKKRMMKVRERMRARGAQDINASTCIEEVRKADLVISATSATAPIIHSQHLKRGAIVCDIALPPDVSPQVERDRSDVTVIKGGVVDIPGAVDFGFDFGLPPGKAYACMAETMVLALESRYENYSLGKQISVEKVHEIASLAHTHGFRVSR